MFKSKYKNLSIKQGDTLLIELHALVLEQNFPETLEMFESISTLVTLPPKFNTETLDLLVKYFYFEEINPPISPHQAFQLLNLAKNSFQSSDFDKGN